MPSDSSTPRHQGTRRFAWLTDIHLDCVTDGEIDSLVESIRNSDCDLVLVGGDIGTAATIESNLTALDQGLSRPIYFVLGNHDYYGSSVAEVRRRVAKLVRASNHLHYLSDEGIVELSAETCLIGNDGWADGRFGDYAHSSVILNDYVAITDFQLAGGSGLSESDKARRLETMQFLAGQASDHFERLLPIALDRYSEVVVLTHVPPFMEASWHEGKISSADYLPHFASFASGDPLMRSMRKHPRKNMLVLCGHTHGDGEAKVLANLTVLTGRAEYGRPGIQRLFDIA